MDSNVRPGRTRATSGATGRAYLQQFPAAHRGRVARLFSESILTFGAATPGEVIALVGRWARERSVCQFLDAERRAEWREVLATLRDDRGAVYADTHNDQIAGTYTMFWLVSPVPPGANGPWPQRITVTVRVEDGESVIFQDIPAPPPAFESVVQLFPVRDPDQVEKIRADARARRRTGP